MELFELRIKRGVERCENFSSENKMGGGYALTGVLNHRFQTHIKYRLLPPLDDFTTPHTLRFGPAQLSPAISTGIPYTSFRLSTPHRYTCAVWGMVCTQRQSFVPALGCNCGLRRS